MKHEELTLKELKRIKKVQEHTLDLVFASFYFAGQFGNKIPVEFGREALKIIINKLQK